MNDRTKSDDTSKLIRQAMSGMTDAQLSRIGFIHVLWNGIERLFAACIWATAGWDQDVGELVTANLTNFARATLLRSLGGMIVREQRLAEHLTATASLYSALCDDRNDLAHGIYVWGFENAQQPGTLVKLDFKKPTAKGLIRKRTILVTIESLDLLIEDMQAFVDATSVFIRSVREYRKAISEGMIESDLNLSARVHGWLSPLPDIQALQVRATLRTHSRNQPEPSNPPPTSPP